MYRTRIFREDGNLQYTNSFVFEEGKIVHRYLEVDGDIYKPWRLTATRRIYLQHVQNDLLQHQISIAFKYKRYPVDTEHAFIPLLEWASETECAWSAFMTILLDRSMILTLTFDDLDKAVECKLLFG